MRGLLVLDTLQRYKEEYETVLHTRHLVAGERGIWVPTRDSIILNLLSGPAESAKQDVDSFENNHDNEWWEKLLRRLASPSSIWSKPIQREVETEVWKSILGKELKSSLPKRKDQKRKQLSNVAVISPLMVSDTLYGLGRRIWKGKRLKLRGKCTRTVLRR